MDAIFLFMVGELIVLGALARRGRLRRATWSAWMGQLAAGACLLGAVRAALVEAPWPHVLGWLAASLPAHLYDVHRRWREDPVGPSQA